MMFKWNKIINNCYKIIKILIKMNLEINKYYNRNH